MDAKLGAHLKHAPKASNAVVMASAPKHALVGMVYILLTSNHGNAASVV
jgi:hypothetical protein